MLTTDILSLLPGIGHHYIERVYNDEMYPAAYDVRIFKAYKFTYTELDNIHAIAICKGSLKVAKLTGRTNNSMQHAFKTENMYRIKWVHDNISSDLSYGINFNLNNLDIVDWYYKTYNKAHIEYAVREGSLLYVMWYCNKFKDYEYEYTELANMACEQDAAKIFAWLYKTYELQDIIDNIINKVLMSRYGYENMLTWLILNFPHKFDNEDDSKEVEQYKQWKLLSSFR